MRQQCGALASGRRPHPAGALPPAPHSSLQEHHALRIPTSQLAASLWAASAPRAVPRAAAAGEAVAQGEAEDEAAPEEEMWCAPAFVSVDNRKNPNFTVMEVEVRSPATQLHAISGYYSILSALPPPPLPRPLLECLFAPKLNAPRQL